MEPKSQNIGEVPHSGSRSGRIDGTRSAGEDDTASHIEYRSPQSYNAIDAPESVVSLQKDGDGCLV